MATLQKHFEYTHFDCLTLTFFPVSEQAFVGFAYLKNIFKQINK